jgi:hypothetical protein
VAGVVLGALLLGSPSISEGQEKAQAAPAAATGGRLNIQALAKIVANYRLLLYSAPQPCTTDPCPVKITLTFVPVNGQDVCIAKIPESLEFGSTMGGNPTKTINWTIDPGGKLIEFHTKSGILLVDDPKQQIKPDNTRTNAVTFSAKNKHNEKGTATYVPVILYRTAPDQPPHLCGTGDPQIVNN